MKTFIRFLVVVLLMVSYTSCDELDELTEVDFDTTLNAQLDVTIAAGEDLIDDTVSINMVNSDTQGHMDVLQNVSITSFKYQLTNFTGDDSGTIITGNLVADGVELLSHDNLVVKQADDANTEFVVTNTTLLNTIASNLKAGNNVIFGLEGQSNGVEMNFTIDITIDLAVTADVL